MRLHEHLLAMRRRGYKPADVWIEVDGSPALIDAMVELNRIPGSHHVVIEPEDVIGALDLRFLVGCRVYVQGENSARVRDVFAAAQDHAADRVVAFIAPVVNGVAGEPVILDSAGRLTAATLAHSGAVHG